VWRGARSGLRLAVGFGGFLLAGGRSGTRTAVVRIWGRIRMAGRGFYRAIRDREASPRQAIASRVVQPGPIRSVIRADAVSQPTGHGRNSFVQYSPSRRIVREAARTGSVSLLMMMIPVLVTAVGVPGTRSGRERRYATGLVVHRCGTFSFGEGALLRSCSARPRACVPCHVT